MRRNAQHTPHQHTIFSTNARKLNARAHLPSISSGSAGARIKHAGGAASSSSIQPYSCRGHTDAHNGHSPSSGINSATFGKDAPQMYCALFDLIVAVIGRGSLFVYTVLSVVRFTSLSLSLSFARSLSLSPPPLSCIPLPCATNV
jgi:hypothetical protein